VSVCTTQSVRSISDELACISEEWLDDDSDSVRGGEVACRVYTTWCASSGAEMAFRFRDIGVPKLSNAWIRDWRDPDGIDGLCTEVTGTGRVQSRARG
jgi:hypothetical protein